MYSHKLKISCFAVIIMAIILNAETRFTVIASGDAHGMVQACDCNIEPGGGLPKRATLINSLGSRDSIILLDAGGFSAGGLYDSYTEGEKADSVKTELMVRGMGALNYDAAGVGDDDLQYGGEWLFNKSKVAGLELVSANCFRKDNSYLFKPYTIITKGNVKIAVTSVASTEKLLQTDPSVIVKEPLKSLRRIWNKICSESDLQIVLSHLGSEETATLLDSLPEIDLAVNGHRKKETAAMTKVNNIPVLQFGFQGKTLSYASVSMNNNKMDVVKNGWYVVSEDIANDRLIDNVIKETKSNKRSNVYDLYIMSECPYGLEALSEFIKFTGKATDITWNIWFIGSVTNDTVLSSLHGDAEIKDEMVWLAVKELYPEKYADFLKNRADTTVPTEVILKKMGFSNTDIEKWIQKNGLLDLTGHYMRSERVNIKASPTLLVNNVQFDKKITADRLLKNECVTDKSHAYCDSMPQCLDETDCRQKGKIGKCVDKKCEYSDAVKFTLTVITGDSTRQKPENTVIATTEDLFAGAMIKKHSMNSIEGISILRKYSPDALPFYLFGIEVKNAYNFDQVESGLIEKNNAFFFRKGIVRNNYFQKRKLDKGNIVLFIDPFFKDIKGIIEALQKDTSLYRKISIVPVIYDDPQKDLWGTEEGFRQEEALRWLVMNKFYKNKMVDYLNEYSKSPGSSYWFSILDKINIKSDAFITTLRANSDLIFSQWKQLLEVSIHEPVAVMFDNRETAVAGNKSELFEMLKGK